MMRIKAFTLIELLIVVAIIAILAAIAVPNFLEAQTRAKVARVKADLRTTGLAMEAYAIDWSKYPPLPGMKWYGENSQQNRGPIAAATPLSTPVAYLSSVTMIDPFVKASTWTGPAQTDITYRQPGQSAAAQACFQYCNTKQLFEDPTSKGGYGSSFPADRPAYWLVSLGPDYMFGPDARRTNDQYWSATHYAVNTDTEGRYDFVAWMYDPSNGTMSKGDIWRNQNK